MMAADKTIGQVVPGLGDQRADVSPLAEPVRRDEGRGSQATQGVGRREQAAEEAAGRGGAGQGDPARKPWRETTEPGAASRRQSSTCRSSSSVSQRRACQVLGQLAQHAAVRGQGRFPRGTAAGGADARTGATASALWLSDDHGETSTGGLAGELQADLSPVAARGLQSADERRGKSGVWGTAATVAFAAAPSTRTTCGLGTSSTTARPPASR